MKTNQELCREIEHRIGTLSEELKRTKELINENKLDEMTDPYQIVREYSAEIKRLQLLRESISEMSEWN